MEKKKDDKEQIITVSFYEEFNNYHIQKDGFVENHHEKWIYEQIYNKELKKSQFIKFLSYHKTNEERLNIKTGKYEISNNQDITHKTKERWFVLDKFYINEIQHNPINDEEVLRDSPVVLLPTGIIECQEEQIDARIRHFVTKWLDVNDDYVYIAIQNIKLYWLYDRFQTINYLRALGDTGTGKSRFLAVFGYIAYKGILSSGATTVSPIFRMIEKWRGTLISDEADIAKSDETVDLIKLFNQGYERNANIMRCNPNDKTKVDFFNPFCPKIIATRKVFEDKAMESRCMTTIMHQTNRKDIAFNLNDSFYQEAETIRNMLLWYRLTNYDKIDTSFAEEPEIKEQMTKYEPRLVQINNPLINLYKNSYKGLKSFFEYMDRLQNRIIEERADSFDGWIIEALAFLILERGINIDGLLVITSKDIDFKLKEMENREKDYNPRLIGKHLKGLGFVVKQKKVDGEVKRFIFWNESNLNSFERYLSDKELLEQITKKLELVRYQVPRVPCSIGKARILKGGENELRLEDYGKKATDLGGYTYVPDTHGTDGTMVPDFYADVKKMQLLETIKQNPKDNSCLIDDNFGSDYINSLLRLGEIYESPKGTYRVLE